MISQSSELKAQKEAFVTGHTGTTPSEVLLVLLSAPIGILANLAVHTFLRTRFPKACRSQLLMSAMEFVLVFMSMCICETEFISSWGVGVLAVEICAAAILRFLLRPLHFAKDAKSAPKGSADLPFVTLYRSSVYVFTIVAILAVDFRIFPRRFAKTEYSGYSLMDIGAGSFIVSSGLVSPFARTSHEKQSRILSSAKMVTSPLGILGFGILRAVTNKNLEYQEHVSEYGVHWNFFFTIFVLRLVPCRNLWGGRWRVLVPLAIGIMYQMALSLGLQDFIEDAPRTCSNGYKLCNFFAANREGILGCIGYLVMFQFSEDVASFCIWGTYHDHTRKSHKISNRNQPMRNAIMDQNLCGTRLFSVSVFLWTLHYLLVTIIPNSRRSTNLPFIIWTLANNISILMLLHFICKTMKCHSLPPSLSISAAINRNGLIVFMIANLLTGAVNLTVHTLEATHFQALVVLTLYMVCVCAVAMFLDRGIDCSVR